MADSQDAGGLLTPSQRDFLRGVGLDEMSNSAKSMTRKRIIDRIRLAVTVDSSLILDAIAREDSYNSLSPEKIIPETQREEFREGLSKQVTIIKTLAEETEESPDEIIIDGFGRIPKTKSERLISKAEQEPKSLTLADMRFLAENVPAEDIPELPEEFSESIDDAISEVSKMIHGESFTKDEEGINSFTSNESESNSG